MRCATLNSGPEFHALDHIGPLAALLGMPLLVTEEKNCELALRYYPQVEVRYAPDLEFRLGEIGAEFDVLFECKYWPPHLKSLLRELHKKEMRLVFCPHGQSDKGFQAPLLAPFATQDAVLLYGELLIQMLKDLGIWPSIKSYALIGNHRLGHYEKHRVFYDRLVEREFPLDTKKRTLLYAPTWRDPDGATSFFQYGALLLSQLPSDWNLIIKIHPLLEQRDPGRFYSFAALADKSPNAVLVHEFPPVYPLLARSDVYLGDASSVGYDFLFFERPLYFFPTAHRGRLHACGETIDPAKNIYAQLEGSNPYLEKQKELYRFAFGAKWDEKGVRSGIFQAIGR